MQVCTSLQTDNHASTPPLSFSQAGCPSCRPTNSVKAPKANSPHCDLVEKNYKVPFYVCLIARHALTTVDEPSPTAFTLSQRQYRSFICSMSPHSSSSLLCYISLRGRLIGAIFLSRFRVIVYWFFFLFAVAAVQILPVMQARPFLQDQDHRTTHLWNLYE